MTVSIQETQGYKKTLKNDLSTIWSELQMSSMSVNLVQLSWSIAEKFSVPSK
jgi:hypothetical protein